MKTLILYYSLEGNTEYLAELLKDKLQADILRVKPLKDIKSLGFSKYVWGGKQVVMNEKPKLEPFNLDLKRYDRIFLGSPVWASTVAPALKTVCDDLIKDKEIYCFYTHEGGDQRFLEKVQILINRHNHLNSVQGFLNVLENKDSMSDALDEWLKKIES